MSETGEESKLGYVKSSTESLRELLMLGASEHASLPASEELKAEPPVVPKSTPKPKFLSKSKPKKGTKKRAPVSLEKFLNATDGPEQPFNSNQSPEEDKKEHLDSAEMSFHTPDTLNRLQPTPPQSQSQYQDQYPGHDHSRPTDTLPEGGDTEQAEQDKVQAVDEDNDNKGSTIVSLSNDYILR